MQKLAHAWYSLYLFANWQMHVWPSWLTDLHMSSGSWLCRQTDTLVHSCNSACAIKCTLCTFHMPTQALFTREWNSFYTDKHTCNGVQKAEAVKYSVKVHLFCIFVQNEKYTVFKCFYTQQENTVILRNIFTVFYCNMFQNIKAEF